MSPEATETRISIPKELYQIRSSRWLMDLAVDWAIIIATLVVFSHFKHWYLVPVAALIIGARLHALGLLAHDGTHRVAFKNSFVNDALTEVLTAWPLFVVVGKGYRPWHLDHHRLLGTEHDPELADYRGFEPYSGKVTWRKIVLYFILDMMGFGVVGLLKFNLAIFPYKHPLRFLGPLVAWGLFFLITYHYGALWIFWLWIWSLVAGFWTVFRIRTWTEHVGVEPDGKGTSHRFEAGPLSRFLFFPHNTFCHYEHHKWPRIPYHNLPALRELVDQAKPVLPLRSLFPSA
jgi:fatty acid desaturase